MQGVKGTYKNATTRQAAAYILNQRATRHAAGLCIYCGLNKIDPTGRFKGCAPCRKQLAEERKEIRSILKQV